MPNTDTLLTAADYLDGQSRLERQARELMPWDPNTCTYVHGPLRQTLFACLTCHEANGATDASLNGLCYSCSIQCHADHTLVELFTKRAFSCDCGTSRIPAHGCCRLRYAPLREGRNNGSSNNGTANGNDAGNGNGNGNGTSSVVDLSTVSTRRRNSLESVYAQIPADDIPSSTNVYGQNFRGLFCSCSKPYDPLAETGNMVQCNFGEACGEEWYHEECVLGLKPGMVERQREREIKHENSVRKVKRRFADGVNVLDILPEAEDEAATLTEITKATNKEGAKDKEAKREKDEKEEKEEGETANPNDSEPLPLEGFPDFDSFEGFVCWKCVNKYRSFFDQLVQYKQVCLDPVYHIEGVTSLEDRNRKADSLKRFKTQDEKGEKEGKKEDEDDKPLAKRIKLEAPSISNEYSVFLKDDYSAILSSLFLKSSIPSVSPSIKAFLLNHPQLHADDPVYEPPEDEDLRSDSGSLIFDLGSRVLESLPRDQAAEGVQAYEMIKGRLKQFLKPFAENREVVTEDKIRKFFDGMNEERR